MTEIGDLSEIGEEITFEWEIKDFASLSAEKDKYFLSPRFYFSGSCWNLKIYPNGETRDTEGWIALYLMKLSSDFPVTLNYTIGLKTIDGGKDHDVNYTYVFHAKYYGYGCPKLITRSVLLHEKSKLLRSGILTVTCTLKNSETKDVVESHFNRLLDVSDNLKEIYQKGKNTDFILKVQGGENMHAHRLILETRSPVFAAMLRLDTKEKQTGEVSIEDLDKNAVDSILNYIYSGDIDRLTTENVLPIYAAAHKYDIKYIIKLCVEFIMDNLSVEWVCDIIKFADLYDEVELGRHAKEYFTERAGEILDTQTWKTFIKENPLMGVELLSSIVKYSLPKNAKDK